MATDRPHPPLWLLRLVLAALSVAVFLRALPGEFVYDDLLMIERNPLVRDPSRIGAIFSSSYWDFVNPADAVRIGYWRPLTALTLAIGYRIGEGSPYAFHVLVVVLHAAAALAAFGLAWRLGAKQDGPVRAALAFFAALLFALHPAQVESVSWITALNNPLFALFAFLGIGAWVRWRAAGSSGLPLGAACGFGLALLAKESAIAMIPAILVVDMLCTGGGALAGREGEAETGRWQPFQRGYGALLAVFAAYYLARVLVFGSPLAGFDRTTTDYGVPFSRLLALRVELAGGFARLAAWPAELNLFRPFTPELSLFDPPLLIAAGIVFALLALAAFLWRRGAQLEASGLLFLFAGFSPVLLRVQQVGTFPYSDRFLYFALFGWGLFLGALLLRRLPVLPAALILFAVSGAYAARSWDRQEVWLDEERLFRATVEQSPNSPNAQWALGRVLLEKYRVGQDTSDLNGAMAAYSRAQDLCARSREDGSIFATSDDTLQSNLGVGWCLLLEAANDPYRDYKTPAELFERLTKNYPASHLPWAGLATARTQLGDGDGAQEAFERSLELNTTDPRTHLNYGILKLERGDCYGAIASFEQNLAIRARHLQGHVWLVRALEACGQAARAKEIAEAARAIAPESPEPFTLLGNLAAAEGKAREARKLFETALQLDPLHGEAHLGRGKLFVEERDLRGAVQALRRACELMPENFEAHFNLGQLLRSEDMELAGRYLIRAYRLRPPGERGALVREQLQPLASKSHVFATELGKTDLALGRLPSALAWARLAFEVVDDYAPARWVEGRALQRMKRTDDAEAPLLSAAERLTNDFEVQEQTGRFLHARGQVDRAQPFLVRALELLPEVEGPPEMRKALEKSLRELIGG